MSDCQRSAQQEIGIERKVDVPWITGGLCRAAEPRRADRNAFFLGISDRPLRLQVEKAAARRGLRFLVSRRPAAQCRGGGAAQSSSGRRRLHRVVPLTLESRVRSRDCGCGIVVDWLVEMVRLPAERMLDHRLARGDWRRADINALADRLARFFATARRVNITPTVYLDRFRAECGDSRHRLTVRAAVPHCARSPIRRAPHRGLHRLPQRSAVATASSMAGCGGTRRSPSRAHLSRTAPQIIDCLEFRADLRCLDPVDELAFLTMECDRMGARGIGPVLFRLLSTAHARYSAARADHLLQGDRGLGPCPHRDPAPSGIPSSRPGKMAEAGRRIPGDRDTRGATSRPLIREHS